MHKPPSGSTVFIQSPSVLGLLCFSPGLGADYPVNNQARHEPSLPGAYIVNGRELLNKSQINMQIKFDRAMTKK